MILEPVVMDEASPLPSEMRSLVAPEYCPPSQFEIMQLPVPEIKHPDELLLKMHAAAVGPGDCAFASGKQRKMAPLSFPIKIAHEGGGVVVAVGRGVTKFKVGDAVYGYNLKHPMLPLPRPGFASDYAVANEDLLLPKPEHMSFEECASMLGSTITAVQVFRRGFELNPDAFQDAPHGDEDGRKLHGGWKTLEGKRVFVTAGLGSATSVAAQIAKNVYRAAEVVTAVSTSKVSLVEKYMPGVVDTVLDYQKRDIVRELRGTIDFMYSSRPEVVQLFPIMRRGTGSVIGSIRSAPRSTTMRKALGRLSTIVGWILDLAQLYYKWKLWGTGVKMDFISGNPGEPAVLEQSGRIIASGKVKAVMTVVPFDDLEAVRKGCEKVASGTGNIGKLVIKIV